MTIRSGTGAAGIGIFSLIAALALTGMFPVGVEASSVYLCQQSEQGRVRLVGSADQCNSTEIAVEIDTSVDLSGIQAQIDGLADRLLDVEVLPAVIAAPLYSLIPDGERSTGCDLLERNSTGLAPRRLVAECNNSGPGIITIRWTHGARAQIAPDPEYVYDGFFLCMTVSDEAIARDDISFHDRVRVTVTPRNLEGDPNAGTLVVIRKIGFASDFRTLNLGSVEEAEIPAPDLSDPHVPCVTFPFSEGTNFVNPHFEFDTWSSPGELEVDIRFPALDGRDHTDPDDGDWVRIYQFGLTVAGRRGQMD